MNGTYYTITEVFDFGPHISKVILDYGKSMNCLLYTSDAADE